MLGYGRAWQGRGLSCTATQAGLRCVNAEGRGFERHDGREIVLGLRPEAPAGSLPALLAGCAALGLAVNLGYALAFSTAVMARACRRARRGIEGALALLFGAAGLRLLWARP